MHSDCYIVGEHERLLLPSTVNDVRLLICLCLHTGASTPGIGERVPRIVKLLHDEVHPKGNIRIHDLGKIASVLIASDRYSVRYAGVAVLGTMVHEIVNRACHQ